MTRDEIDLKLQLIGESFLTEDEWNNIRPYYWQEDLITILNARGVVGNPLQDWFDQISVETAKIEPKNEVFIGAAL
jgi:hypothetical protein